MSEGPAEADTGIDLGFGPAEGGGAGRGVEALPGSISEIPQAPSGEVQQGLAPAGSEEAQTPAEAPPPGSDRDRGVPAAPEASRPTGGHVPEGFVQRPVTKQQLSFALRGANGNRQLAADALGITRQAVDHRIKEDDQLRAIWGSTNQGDTVQEPGRAEAMVRGEFVQANQGPSDIELAELVSDTDTRIFRDGLAALGVSDAMRKKLKALDKLATSGGAFLSTSLQMTHRGYIVQVMRLYDQIDNLLAILDADYAEKDPKLKLSAFDRAMYLKMYVEMVKESGKGYKTTLDGTTAMARMMLAARDQGKGGGNKRKPGWGIEAEKKEEAGAQD